MSIGKTAVRFNSMGSLRSGLFEASQVPFAADRLIHFYIRLDIDSDVEFADTKESAQRYLGAVAEAALLVHHAASATEFNGLLLEPQGSTIHAAIPCTNDYPGTAIKFACIVHGLLSSRMMKHHPCVKGWRMTADMGRTLVIAGPGVHGDRSLVSIGNAANRPAKHLYQQLWIAEEMRRLKRYALGLRNHETDSWEYVNLEKMPLHEIASHIIRALPSELDYKINMVARRGSGSKLVTAQAYPISPAGSAGSPTAEQPGQHHGWVMRADLDGFTARVASCFDEDDELEKMAVWFVNVMECATGFVLLHEESMIQLPWAGDNFTVAIVFNNKNAYDDARRARLVEHALDFDDEMREVVGPTGWAYGICGGDVHGNAVGNVFIGSVDIGSIRFLVGAGAGFSRSLQAFVDLKPMGGVIDIFVDDYNTLKDGYKSLFKPATRVDGKTSTLFDESRMTDLGKYRDRRESGDRTISVMTAPAVTVPLTIKPYATRYSKDNESSL